MKSLHAAIDPLDEATLRARRKNKWARSGRRASRLDRRDGLPLAPEITDAVRAVLDRHDLGYPHPYGLAESFAD